MTPNTTRRTMYDVQCTTYDVQCTMYDVQCTSCGIRRHVICRRTSYTDITVRWSYRIPHHMHPISRYNEHRFIHRRYACPWQQRMHSNRSCPGHPSDRMDLRLHPLRLYHCGLYIRLPRSSPTIRWNRRRLGDLDLL